MHYCPFCEIELPDDAHFCSHCGCTIETTIVVKSVASKKQFLPVSVQLVDGSTVATFSRKVLDGGTVIQCCPSCETELTHNARFCSHCGRGLEATTTIDDVPNMRTPPPIAVKPVDGSTIGSRISTIGYKVLGKLPMPVQHVIAGVLTRAGDPKPEASHANRQKALRSQPVAWGWLPLLALTSTFGTLSVAHAFTSARLDIPGAEFFFWFGLLLIFVPATGRLISPAASRLSASASSLLLESVSISLR